MESYRTEEEQVEALKNWWDENGRTTIIALVVALGLGFSWQGWQSHKLEQAEAASVVYQGLLEAMDKYTAEASDDAVATATHLAGELKTDYAGSTYSHYAALALAKFAVDRGDLEAAKTELHWLLSDSLNQDVELVAQQRLARVLAASGETEQALKILDSTDAGKYGAAYATARGDIYLSLGENDKALQAYQQARAYSPSADTDNQPYLDMKIKHLNLQPATVIGEEDNQ